MKGIDNETLSKGLVNLFDVVNGDGEFDEEEYEEMTERGLTEEQLEIAEKYEGEGRFEVDESHVPMPIEKLAEKKKIPTTFVVDGVPFVQKTQVGSMSSITGVKSEWFWTESGYHITFYNYKEDYQWKQGKDRVAFTEVNHE